MEFRLLGPLEAWDGADEVALGGRRQRTLLAALLVHRRQAVSPDRLVEALWGDDASGEAIDTLQSYVSRLRRALGPEGAALVQHRPAGYVLQTDQVDAERFEREAEAGREAIGAGDDATGARLLHEALTRWRGSALVEFADQAFFQPEAVRLDEMRLAVLGQRIEADLARGRHAELVAELEALTANHPLHEGLWGQLMRALAGADRRADALRAYQQARRVLGEGLGLDPSAELRRLEQQILLQDPALSPGREHHPGPVTDNLPADATSFIGRQMELAALAGLFEDRRLVTLTGPGGVGKSRLAVEAARRLLDRFPAGAWLVELSSVVDPAQLVGVIATTVGVEGGAGGSDLGAVADHLGAGPSLLVLDNCEHLVAACAEVVEPLLSRLPELRVLATSREPLALVSESAYPVGPLPTPDRIPVGLDADDALEYDAVRLFVERASAVRPTFALSRQNLLDVMRVCHRLDGLPLALELAAARCGAFTVNQIAGGLDDSMRTLGGDRRAGLPHHQTLGATFDWSFALLSSEEQRLLQRLSVFFLDFPGRAVEVICTGDGIEESEVLGLLSRLVAKSLVTMEERHGEARYRLLRTVRAHALQIEQRDEEQDLHNRSFFFALAQQTDARLRGSEQEMWSVLLEGDVALVRETLLRGFRSHAREQGAFLAGAAAALKSRSGRVGYIGGVKTDQLETFQAGYEAGARHVDPSVSLDAAYLSQAPDFSGFWQPRAAKRKAIEMYGRGADVIFHAAGPAAGGGVFEAARQVSERSGHRWVIGVDFDEYLQVEDELRPHVLTSMRLQVPVAVYRRIREAVENGDASNPRFDLASEGVGLSASGGYLDDVSEDLEQLRQQIVAGQIRVPTTPAAQTRRGPVGPKR